ncbi:MAG: iron-sulfur cluster assembly accessory protein [Nannocystaceae bacterium]|nr:iron-sulfur cluster assembly accessory protein [Nannocystaceae bacterium]
MNAAAIEPPTVATPEPPPTVTITARAAKMMQGQLVKRGTPQAAIRFGIRGGGCTGYSYMFQFEDGPPRASDHVIEAFGVRMYVDPKSMRLVKHTRIDFETGIRGHGYRFENPNVSSACGCGESVTF